MGKIMYFVNYDCYGANFEGFGDQIGAVSYSSLIYSHTAMRIHIVLDHSRYVTLVFDFTLQSGMRSDHSRV